MTLERNYLKLKENINIICERIGKSPDEITIIAVSKTFPVANIMELYRLGQMDFGESKVRELRDKYYNLSFHFNEQIKWHLIGHLQTNKVKNVVAFINLIHSVDSFKLAEVIDIYSKKVNRIIDILIQVNTTNEPQKFGIEPSTAEELCKQISVLENVRLKGLMTMAKLTYDKNAIRDNFKILKGLFDDLKSKYMNFEYLSMGMTNDYDIAIEEGSNMLRIGSAIFGHRE